MLAATAVVVLASSLAHLGAICLPFQWDDALILRDDNVRLGRIQAFVLPPVPRFLTWITFTIQFRLNGDEPAAWHAANVLIHAVNAGLVFILLSLILVRPDLNKEPRWDRIGAMFGALAFALHPVQSEAVFYVYQRSALLSVGFGLLAWILFLKQRPGLAAGSWVVAVACKESALVFPVVFWLSSGLLWRRWKIDRFLAFCLAAAGTGVGLHAVYWHWVGETTLGGSPAEALAYLATQVTVWWRYAALVLHADPLNLDHDVPLLSPWPGILWWSTLTGSAILLLVLVLLRKRAPLAVLFGAAFVVLLLPTSSIIPSQDLMFEHRLYGSMFGWAGLIALLSRRSSERLERRSSLLKPALGVALTAVLLTMVGHDTWATQKRMRDWATPETLWRDAVEKSPNKYRPNLNLGVLLMENSPAEAARYLTRAIELDASQPMAYRSLGEVHLAARQIEQARALWMRALTLDPEDPYTLLAMGRARARERDYFGAARFYQKARALAPREWRTFFYEARLNLDFGLVERAIALCEESLEQDPSRLRIRQLLIECMWQTGNLERAVELCRGELSRQESSQVYFELAALLGSLGKISEATSAAVEGLLLARSPQETLQGAELLRKLKLSIAPRRPVSDEAPE